MKIPINDKAKYQGRTMRWTEHMSPATVKAGDTVYHVSDTRIKSFAPILTCFFSECPDIDGHYYAITLNANVACLESDCGEEIRIDLDANRDAIDIQYIGSLASEYAGKEWVKGHKYGCPKEERDGEWFSLVSKKIVTDKRYLPEVAGRGK